MLANTNGRNFKPGLQNNVQPNGGLFGQQTQPIIQPGAFGANAFNQLNSNRLSSCEACLKTKRIDVYITHLFELMAVNNNF